MKAETIAPFQLYQASAGAGKTFLLVQQYLAKLLSSQQEDRFHRMLALTFTNKAVFEMKFRLLKQLHYFASTQDDLSQHPMGKPLLEELKISSEELQRRAEINLQLILHDYAAFDIITLDSFTHRVVRSFAKDLGLAYNFEVELQSDRILEKVVEQVIDAVGEDQQLTALLEAFTFQKMDDADVSSWDLKANLMDAAKLLLKENDREEIKRFIKASNHTIEEQYRILLTKKETIKQALMRLGKSVLEQLNDAGLVANDFNRGTLYKRFENLSKGDFKKYDEGKLHENLLAGKNIHKATTPEAAKAQIEILLPTFLASYEEGLVLFRQWQLLNDLLKQWIPLNLLAVLSRTLDAYQTQSNRVLLSTFNERIEKEVLCQPSPYIYERMGENYRHYFLDEFQDTSSLQWNNLIPLIKSSIESELESGHTGSLLLVGDPKQSIYRWRGGNVEQFIDLIGSYNPFTVEKEEHTLGSNYRSAEAIVAFNNALFTALPKYLTYEENKVLFGDRAVQGIENQKGGYVRLSFLDSTSNKEEDAYALQIVEDITRCRAKGYDWEDMAILVRTGKQAKSIGTMLAQAKLPFSSSESLVLKQSISVNFLMTLVYLKLQANDLQQKKIHLTFLFESKHRSVELHDYLYRNLGRPLRDIWEEEGIVFNLDWLSQRSLYAVFQLACARFPAIASNDAFVLCFLDEVFNFSLQETANLNAFLMLWEAQLHQKTIPSTNSDAGIRLMTIHKAKGLEFPLVFFPYADRQIHSSTKEKLWLNTTSVLGDDFPLAWVNKSARVANYGSEAAQRYFTKLREEEVDAWNVFYVATTRASEQLYLYASLSLIEKESYAGFLANFVQGVEEECVHEWGQFSGKIADESSTVQGQQSPAFSSHYPYEEKLMLQRQSSKELEQARHFGIKIHELISKIDYADELETVMEDAYFQGEITAEEKKQFLQLFDQLVHSSSLTPYFSRDFSVLNEQDIMLPKAKIIRPDRLVHNQEKVVIIDYKTGAKKDEDRVQVQEYAHWVTTIFERPTTAYLVYLDMALENQIDIVEVSAT